MLDILKVYASVREPLDEDKPCLLKKAIGIVSIYFS